MRLRMIGDCHGMYSDYLPLLEGVDYSLQVGDLGLNYAPLKKVKIDTTKHRALAGNHDNYSEDSPHYFKKQPIFLGDFGLYEIAGMPPIFYMRGAWSIDHLARKRSQGWPYNLLGPVCWWEEEELSMSDLEAAIAFYQDMKPEFVMTHECPFEIVKNVTDPKFAQSYGHENGEIKTRTNQALQIMFDFHQPKQWFFGHYHHRWSDQIRGTQFTCLDMLRSQTDNKDANFDIEFSGD